MKLAEFGSPISKAKVLNGGFDIFLGQHLQKGAATRTNKLPLLLQSGLLLH